MYAAPTSTNATPDFFKIFKNYSLYPMLLLQCLQGQTILIRHSPLSSSSSVVNRSLRIRSGALPGSQFQDHNPRITTPKTNHLGLESPASLGLLSWILGFGSNCR